MPSGFEELTERELVPGYHLACAQSRALIETLADASLEAKAALYDVMDQFFVETATWGLDLWEQQVGIETDRGLSHESRRGAIKQKLVASGQTTSEMVRQLAETITGYEARVHINQDYSFSLEFLGEKTELADIDVEELRSVVEQIKPAHLRFIITGITWNDLESMGLTWQWFEDNQITWAGLESKFCIHGKNKGEFYEQEIFSTGPAWPGQGDGGAPWRIIRRCTSKP